MSRPDLDPFAAVTRKETRECAYCGYAFAAYMHQRYCCEKCQQRAAQLRRRSHPARRPRVIIDEERLQQRLDWMQEQLARASWLGRAE